LCAFDAATRQAHVGARGAEQNEHGGKIAARQTHEQHKRSKPKRAYDVAVLVQVVAHEAVHVVQALCW
jgi:hypothetical protein